MARFVDPGDRPSPLSAGSATPSWLAPSVWGKSLLGVVEAALDAAVQRAVADPIPVQTAEEVRTAVRAPAAAGVSAVVVPALAGVTKRLSTRVLRLGSRLSFSVKALLAVVPPLATSVTLGTRELHALASLVVNRLRAEGLPVDRRFVQRVTVNAYVWPGGGRPLEQAQAPALVRVAGLWATRPLAGWRAGDWAGRAADTIEAADLRRHLARYTNSPPALGPGA